MPAEEQSFPSVWARPRRRRREQPALSQEQIVSEALQLLDSEGIDALSMRRLGNRLGAVATAVYWHVANKDELIELVIDEIYGEVEVPEVDDPAAWREAAAATARSLRSMILRHPWIVSVIDEVALCYLGPNLMRASDRMLGIFTAGGFDLVEADQAMKTLIAYVLGMAASEAAMLTRLAGSGRTEQEWVESISASAEEAARPYPRLHALYTTDPFSNPERVRVDNFGYGLDRVLDGLQARLTAAKS
ncbi:TetR/AcrR family transcriptional regulator C-terminal domain-containing protein [Nonomuraea sp. NPDC000554]|uniref:TetR/AcrR family transcriptional regulator n=1 Tax=Nonomuraea sp. NPDC000554 TaxID=3154259 RepID=UPI003319255F